jgi:metallo-beta-lactamase family protein
LRPIADNGVMKLQFLGATGTVTGSKYLLSSGAASVLFDCGLFQGFKQLRLRNWAPLPLDPGRLDAVVLSHAHIDHSGYLPLAVRNGFRGKVYCTPATHELCRILLPDSAFLQEEQAEHANRHGYSKHRPALPLYTRRDAEQALRHFAPVAYGRSFEPAPGLRARFDPAGHILGAAITTFSFGGRTLVFSGDLGRLHDAIMPAPAAITRADTLVLESTYGNRTHDPADPVAELGRIVSQTAARVGTVVIPSFAVGRAQALLWHLARLRESEAIPRALPIYLDSPMAIDVTGLYRDHNAEHRLDDEQCHAMGHVARYVQKPEESRALDQSEWPAVIIAGSGMAAGGRVLHHLKHFAPDPRTTILFTGFQAGGTRGAAMVAGARDVKIHGTYVAVRAEVRNLDNLSAHADRDELVTWARGFERPPGRVFLTHGEPAAADALRVRLAEELGWAAEVPEYRDEVDLA